MRKSLAEPSPGSEPPASQADDPRDRDELRASHSPDFDDDDDWDDDLDADPDDWDDDETGQDQDDDLQDDDSLDDESSCTDANSIESATAHIEPDSGSRADPSCSELVNAIQIELTFDVGQTKVDVHTLRTLLPGYTFTLDTSLELPVAIKAYGQLVGRGELLCVQDRLGVRLAEVTENGC